MGARISAVKGKDREWFHDLIRRCISNSGMDVNMREVARESMARVEAVATSAEDEADRAMAIRILRAMAEDGTYGQVDVVLKEERVVVMVMWDGTEQEFTIPSRVAVRDPQTHAWVHHDHEDLPRPLYVRYVSGLRKSAERTSVKLAAHEAKIALLNEYPAAVSVRDARRMAEAAAAGQMELAI